MLILPFNIFVLQFGVRIKLCWQRYHFLAYLWTLHFSNIMTVVRFHFQYMQYKLFFRRKNFVALAYKSIWCFLDDTGNELMLRITKTIEAYTMLLYMCVSLLRQIQVCWNWCTSQLHETWMKIKLSYDVLIQCRCIQGKFDECLAIRCTIYKSALR